MGRTCDRIGAREVLAGAYAAPGRGTCEMRERAYFDGRSSRGAFAKASALLTREGKTKTTASATSNGGATLGAMLGAASVNNIAAVGLDALKDLLHGVVAKVIAAGGSSEAVASAIESVQIEAAAADAAEAAGADEVVEAEEEEKSRR